MDCRRRESPRSDVLEGNIINQSKVSFGVLQVRSNSNAERWNLGQRLSDMFDICKRDFQKGTLISFVYFNFMTMYLETVLRRRRVRDGSCASTQRL